MSAVRHSLTGRRRQRLLRLEAWKRRAFLDGFSATFSLGAGARQRTIESPLDATLRNFARASERVMLRLGYGPEWEFDELVAGRG